ncbi:hypothetical protein NBRC116590_34980 [Pelagimonas sp. KU-00592-HH]
MVFLGIKQLLHERVALVQECGGLGIAGIAGNDLDVWHGVLPVVLGACVTGWRLGVQSCDSVRVGMGRMRAVFAAGLGRTGALPLLPRTVFGAIHPGVFRVH